MNKEYLIRLNNQKLRNEQVLSKKLKENRMLGVGEIDMFGSSDGIALDGTEQQPNTQRYEEEAKFLLNKYISDSQAINRIINSLSERQLRSLVLNFTSIEANLLENLQSQRVDKNIFLEQLKEEINKNIKLSETGSSSSAAASSTAPAPSTPLPSTPAPPSTPKRSSPAASTPSMTPLPARINSSSSTGSGDKDKILEALSQLLYTNNISQKIYNTLVAQFNLYSTGIDEEDFNEIKTNLNLIVEYDDYQKSFKNFLVDNSKEIFNKTYTKPKSVEDVKKRFRTLPLAVLITFYSVAMKEIPLQKKSGRGLPNHDLHYHLNDKYYIPKNKLGAGILEVRYTKNKHLTNLKPQYMSNELKKIVNDIVSRKTFDTRDYHKMNIFDQGIARNLNEKLGLGVNVHDDESLDNRFQIVKGAILAGNNNHSLLAEARRFILMAISTGKMSRQMGYDLLTELGL